MNIKTISLSFFYYLSIKSSINFITIELLEVHLLIIISNYYLQQMQFQTSISYDKHDQDSKIPNAYFEKHAITKSTHTQKLYDLTAMHVIKTCNSGL